MFSPPVKPPITQFGCEVDTPKHKEGFVETAKIPELIDACGVTDERGEPIKSPSIPFTGFARRDGEPWHLRIEPAAPAPIGGGLVMAHRWTFALAAGGTDQAR